MESLLHLCHKIKIWILFLFQKIEIKFQEQFGFHIKEVTFVKLSEYLNASKDSSSLAMSRILFGITMLFDIPDERGGAIMDKRWGEPSTCHFPLIPFVRAMPMPYMALVYAGLWIGAFGIALGYKYRWSASMFTVCYWYIFLIEKSYWNNHSYLFGLVALLFTFTEANCYWSLDVYLNPSQSKPSVPYWNYFILKYQFFILYFMAGLKKGTAEWLTGYSVQNLSEHWVFNPFKLFLTAAQTDFLIVHWFVFAFDLTVAMWMMWARTRHVAMFFCALFHLMNSRLFSIGMFPWVCLATMPLFYPFDWPKIILKYAEEILLAVKGGIYKYIHRFIFSLSSHQQNATNITNKDSSTENKIHPDNEIIFNNQIEKIEETETNINEKERDKLKHTTDGRMNSVTFALIVFHLVSQAFLPYSHFITKHCGHWTADWTENSMKIQGYNNWTKGLYGYSWDMMVHTWDIDSVVIKVVDNKKRETFYVDPYVYSPNDRWTRHGDMVYQYAKCLKDNIRRNDGSLSTNISIYIDVWCSMNGRFTQRMFDPKVDLLNVSWSPFEPVSYLMPLLDEALKWRSVLQEIKEDVHSWNNYSDVIFIADFPGYVQEKYIPLDLFNVTMTMLDGIVAYEPEITTALNGQSYQLGKGNKIKLHSGTFHKILNIGTTPAYYMYTIANSTEATNFVPPTPKPKLPVDRELTRRLINMMTFAKLVVTNTYEMLFKFKHCS